MILPQRQDALHKAMLYRLLTGIIDNPYLSGNLFFKGGTAASMLGWLNRFSLDLDFDLKNISNKAKIDSIMQLLVRRLGFLIKEKASNELFYVLKYRAPLNQRQYLKLSIISEIIKANKYQIYFLPEINRYCRCQTQETMFANKLVALTERFHKHQVIAGRDLYDIHYFFLQGFSFNKKVIEERTKGSWQKYKEQLTQFIIEKITQKVIDEDLNYLLTPDQFKIIRTVLKSEVLRFLATA